MDRILYNLKDAAAQLSISVSTVEQLIAQGDLRVRRIGKRRLVPRQELEKLALRDVSISWPERKHPAEGQSA